MNQEIKKEWVAALRSGKYPQGSAALCMVAPSGWKAYCCLGVLAELAALQGIVEASYPDVSSDPEYSHAARYDEYAVYLPPAVMKWAGLDSEDPVVENIRLSVYNDVQAKSFEEIADLIEQHL